MVELSSFIPIIQLVYMDFYVNNYKPYLSQFNFVVLT